MVTFGLTRSTRFLLREPSHSSRSNFFPTGAAVCLADFSTTSSCRACRDAQLLLRRLFSHAHGEAATRPENGRFCRLDISPLLGATEKSPQQTLFVSMPSTRPSLVAILKLHIRGGGRRSKSQITVKNNHSKIRTSLSFGGTHSTGTRMHSRRRDLQQFGFENSLGSAVKIFSLLVPSCVGRTSRANTA